MSKHSPLVLSVSSGKGGVGKTNISANLAASLSRSAKVILLDADFGLANVDILLGENPQYDIFSFFTEGKSLSEILHPTAFGFSILPAPSGIASATQLSTGQKLELLDAMDDIADGIDYLIVDTGAGLNDSVLYFNMAAQERLIVVTPEPSAITDAYALIKMLKIQHGIETFHICVNMAESKTIGLAIFKRLCEACDRFLLSVSLDFVGIIPQDPQVRAAVMKQQPFTVLFPHCPASIAIEESTKKIARWQGNLSSDGNIKFFWKKLLFQ